MGKRENTKSLARLALRRTERKRKIEIAPVRRTLVETWRGVGSSFVAKMEGTSEESSMGPSSSMEVAKIGHGVRRLEEREWVEVGLWRKMRGDREGFGRG